MARERDIDEVNKEKGYNIKRYFVLFIITTVGFIVIGLLYNAPNVNHPLGIVIKWFLWGVILLLLMITDDISDFIRKVETFTSAEDYKKWRGTKLKLIRRSASTDGLILIIAVVFTGWVLYFMPESFMGDIKIVNLFKNSIFVGIITVFLMEISSIDNVYIYKTPARQLQN